MRNKETAYIIVRDNENGISLIGHLSHILMIGCGVYLKQNIILMKNKPKNNVKKIEIVAYLLIQLK